MLFSLPVKLCLLHNALSRVQCAATNAEIQPALLKLCQHYKTVLKLWDGIMSTNKPVYIVNKLCVYVLQENCAFVTEFIWWSSCIYFQCGASIYPAAFPLLVSKCGPASVSCLWVLLRPKAPQPTIHHQILIRFHHSTTADIWFIALGALFEFKSTRDHEEMSILTWGRVV